MREIAADGIAARNVVTVRLLALCPMLAVTVSVQSAMLLGVLTAAVMAVAGALVSLTRRWVPDSARLPVFLLIVAAAVAAADTLVAAYAYDAHQQLGIFLPLIITNCAVLARLELFAFHQSPLRSAADGLFSGGGMLLALTALATARELLAHGAVFGVAIADGGSPIALLPVGGFIIFGLMLAAIRWFNQRNNTAPIDL